MAPSLYNGALVTFGNGTKKRIATVSRHNHEHYMLLVEFTDGTRRSYMLGGKHHYGTTNHDIVKVRKKRESQNV